MIDCSYHPVSSIRQDVTIRDFNASGTIIPRSGIPIENPTLTMYKHRN